MVSESDSYKKPHSFDQSLVGYKRYRCHSSFNKDAACLMTQVVINVVILLYDYFGSLGQTLQLLTVHTGWVNMVGLIR